MKILFDEGVPRQLRHLLAGYEITLVQEAGWSGVKNGRLLRLAQEGGFTVFVTSDQELKHQQNLKDCTLAIIVLPYNRRKWMPLLAPELQTVLRRVQRGDYVELRRPEKLP